MRVRVGRSRDAFWLCLLKGGNPEPSLFTHSPIHPFLLFASSRCRFYCRFWMPLLVVVWQNKITARYNTADQLQMSKESES